MYFRTAKGAQRDCDDVRLKCITKRIRTAAHTPLAFEPLATQVKDLQERKVRLPPKRVLFHTLTEDFVQQRRHQLVRHVSDPPDATSATPRGVGGADDGGEVDV